MKAFDCNRSTIPKIRLHCVSVESGIWLPFSLSPPPSSSAQHSHCFICHLMYTSPNFHLFCIESIILSTHINVIDLCFVVHFFGRFVLFCFFLVFGQFDTNYNNKIKELLQFFGFLFSILVLFIRVYLNYISKLAQYNLHCGRFSTLSHTHALI